MSIPAPATGFFSSERIWSQMFTRWEPSPHPVSSIVTGLVCFRNSAIVSVKGSNKQSSAMIVLLASTKSLLFFVFVGCVSQLTLPCFLKLLVWLFDQVKLFNSDPFMWV